jgi:hypothetical protein
MFSLPPPPDFRAIRREGELSLALEAESGRRTQVGVPRKAESPRPPARSERAATVKAAGLSDHERREAEESARIPLLDPRQRKDIAPMKRTPRKSQNVGASA